MTTKLLVGDDAAAQYGRLGSGSVNVFGVAARYSYALVRPGSGTVLEMVRCSILNSTAGTLTFELWELPAWFFNDDGSWRDVSANALGIPLPFADVSPRSAVTLQSLGLLRAQSLSSTHQSDPPLMNQLIYPGAGIAPADGRGARRVDLRGIAAGLSATLESSKKDAPLATLRADTKDANRGAFVVVCRTQNTSFEVTFSVREWAPSYAISPTDRDENGPRFPR